MDAQRCTRPSIFNPTALMEIEKSITLQVVEERLAPEGPVPAFDQLQVGDVAEMVRIIVAGRAAVVLGEGHLDGVLRIPTVVRPRLDQQMTQEGEGVSHSLEGLQPFRDALVAEG